MGTILNLVRMITSIVVAGFLVPHLIGVEVGSREWWAIYLFFLAVTLLPASDRN